MRTPGIRILMLCQFLFLAMTSQAQDLTLLIPDQQTICKSTIDIPVRVSRFRGIITMQGSISWDTAMIRFDSIAFFGPVSLNLRSSNFGVTQTAGGKLFFSWDDPAIRGVSLPDASDLFMMRFTIRPRTNSRTEITVGGKDVELEFLDSSGRTLQVSSRNGIIDLGFDLPDYNPFADTTTHCGVNITLDAGAGYLSYVWGPADTLRTFIAGKDSLYRITTRNELGCVGLDSTYLRLFPVPLATLMLMGDSLFCEGDLRILKADGGVEFRWFRNGIRMPGRSSDTLQVRAGGRYTVEVYSDKGCLAVPLRAYDMNMVTKPILAFSERGVCSEVPVTFINRSAITSFGKIDWRWDFGDGITATNPDSVAHIFSLPGDYRISLAYRNTLCPSHADTLRKAIVLKRERDRRYPDVRTLIDHPTTVSARDSGASYRWLPVTGLQTPTIRKPVVTLRQNQEYIISVTLSNGCVVFDTLRVTLGKDPGIYLPKAFSPNGDGQNDRLIPFLVGIAELRHFRVYNRWGNLIHHSGNANYYTGWDGTYRSLAQPNDTYIWTAVGIDVKGQLITSRGSTLLIR